MLVSAMTLREMISGAASCGSRSPFGCDDMGGLWKKSRLNGGPYRAQRGSEISSGISRCNFGISAVPLV
jgi:hypothetical protein